MKPKRILVAVDTTQSRDAAFEHALALARATGAELYVLHAVPANQPFSAHARRRFERMLELRARAETAGVRVQTSEQHGDPAEIIELHATARAVDLIVVGSRPRTGWFPRRQSPIAERVLSRTNHPTLVVADSGRVTDGRFRNVLVAVDLSEGSEHLVRRAAAWTAGDSPQLTVMHSVTRLEAIGAVQSPARWAVPEYRAHVLDDARRRLQALVAAVAGASDAQVRIATGPAADGVLDASAGVDADLIVVGKNRGFRPLGSTALRVLRRNDRALLVIPMAHAESVAHAGERRAA